MFNAPFSNTRSVVELALSEIIALTRRLTDKSTDMHAGIWDKSAVGSHEVRGRRLGIVGYGNIGSQLSVLAEALGMSVLFYDTADKLALGNARRCGTLDELLAESDVVSLHVDGRAGQQRPVRRGAVRRGCGPAASSSTCPAASSSTTPRCAGTSRRGHLAGAAVDVFPVEPKSRGEQFVSELRGLRNVILTPHVGGSTEEAQQDIGAFVAGKLRDYVAAGTTAAQRQPAAGAPAARRRHRPAAAAAPQHARRARRASTACSPSTASTSRRRCSAPAAALGYVVTDVAAPQGRGVADALLALPETVRLRVLRVSVPAEALPAALLDDLRDAVGAEHVLLDRDVVSSYEHDWTGRFSGTAGCVVRPADTAQVVAVVQACGRAGVPLVVQGGNTGLVGGGVPAGGEVVLSLRRLTALGEVDVAAGQVTAGAGVTLADLQRHVRAAGADFGVDLAARDSATVGGLVATNAGGIRVLRHGSMRAQLRGRRGRARRRLGRAPDGRAAQGRHRLRPRRSCWPAARARSASSPRCACASCRCCAPAAPRCSRWRARRRPSTCCPVLRERLPHLAAAEVFYEEGLALVRRHGGLPAPFEEPAPVYLLLECLDRTDPSDDLLAVVAEAEGLIDARVASDASSVRALWAYREAHTEADQRRGRAGQARRVGARRASCPASSRRCPARSGPSPRARCPCCSATSTRATCTSTCSAPARCTTRSPRSCCGRSRPSAAASAPSTASGARSRRGCTCRARRPRSRRCAR